MLLGMRLIGRGGGEFGACGMGGGGEAAIFIWGFGDVGEFYDTRGERMLCVAVRIYVLFCVEE